MRLIRYTDTSPRTFTSGALARSPWVGLESEMDRLFAAAWSDLGMVTSGHPCPVDVYQDRDSLHVRAELPGFRREEIAVEMADGYLTITATRPASAGEAARSVRRSVRIADDIQTDRVTAAYEHGVLQVTLPGREEAKPRKVAVTVN